jgi:adenine phosphoribosyltransferase
MESISDLLRRTIRDVPDFPKKGIVFKDITPVLGDGAVYRRVVDELVARWKQSGIDQVVGIESRGFIFAAPLAYALGAGLSLVRKPGKLPWETIRESYSLEYGQDALELHIDSVGPGERVLVVDDLLATGGTAEAEGWSRGKGQTSSVSPSSSSSPSSTARGGSGPGRSTPWSPSRSFHPPSC